MSLQRLLKWVALPVLMISALVATAWHFEVRRRTDPPAVRAALLAELQPVRLTNCTLKRFGGANDGGYLMCENLIPGVESAYSYGIGGSDAWGCDVSTQYDVAVHQYDCFDVRSVSCDGGRLVRHDACIGPEAKRDEEWRVFDTLANQIARNGDAAKRILVKMDVEGAEWDSLLATPDEILARIDQLPMEFHGVDQQRFVTLVKKLKRTFHLVHLHFNNWACSPDVAPFPAVAYQVLFVNKRLGVARGSVTGPLPGRALDAPDAPTRPDCQLR